MTAPQHRSALGAVYRGLSHVAGTVLPLVAAWKGVDFRQRLGRDGPPSQPDGLWVHGASVGELASARVVIAALAREFPVTVTSNSLTGRDAARDWGFQACLAPLDVPGALCRFLDRVQPAVQVTIENEIWPNRAAALRARGIPQVVIGARMSARSARRWSRMPGLIAPVLAGIDTLSAQDHATEARLLDLGLPPGALVGRLQLKLLAPAAVTPGSGGPWRDRTILAASTHEGEEAVILDGWLRARAADPALRLILAPRHPLRGDEVAAMIAGRGLAFQRRSQGGDESAPLLLADTMGEMARWYDRAAICVTGGSFTDRGGHTPWEPAAHCCAILHGPHVENFSSDYRELEASGASLEVSADSLGDVLTALAGDVSRRARMGQAARAVLMRDAGDPTPLLDRIRVLARAGLATDR